MHRWFETLISSELPDAISNQDDRMRRQSQPRRRI